MNQMLLEFEPSKVDVTQKCEAVIALLSTGPKTTDELESDPRVVRRAAATIRNLRQSGWNIETSRHPSKNIAVYTLIGKVAKVEVTDDMKQRYYATDHWAAKRLERLRFDGFKCVVCGSLRDLQVHHWKYDLFNEDIKDLLTVCGDDHLRIHEYPNVTCHFPKYVVPEIADKLLGG